MCVNGVCGERLCVNGVCSVRVRLLTRYHASEGGGGVAALSGGWNMRRVAWQSGAGEISTCNDTHKHAQTHIYGVIRILLL